MKLYTELNTTFNKNWPKTSKIQFRAIQCNLYFQNIQNKRINQFNIRIYSWRGRKSNVNLWVDINNKNVPYFSSYSKPIATKLFNYKKLSNYLRKFKMFNVEICKYSFEIRKYTFIRNDHKLSCISVERFSGCNNIWKINGLIKAKQTLKEKSCCQKQWNNTIGSHSKWNRKPISWKFRFIKTFRQ